MIDHEETIFCASAMLYENELAYAIARMHFGVFVGDVAQVLLRHPRSTLLDLTRRAGGSKRATKDALSILLAHGAAAVEGDSPPVYRAEPLALLMRIRHALYAGLAERQYGELGRLVVEALFARGRLTASALFRVALDAGLASLGVDDIAACCLLADMARAGLLAWCGSRTHGLASRKRRHADVDSDDEDDDDGTSNLTAHHRASAGGETILVGCGTARRAVGAPARDNDDDVWCVSYWYLNRCFRNEACRMVVASRVPGRLPLEVLITGMDLALGYEDAGCPADDIETCEVTTDAIQRALAGNDVAASDRDFWAAVRALVELDPPCVKAVPEDAPQRLRFVPGRLIAEVRQQTLEEMVLQRYEKAGRRIFRALAIDGCMEDKMIAEKCMLDIKMVREKLFSMRRDKLVSVQEVPRSHEQQRSNSNWYLWRVRPTEAYECSLRTMYKAQTNLMLRLESVEKAPEEKGEGKTLRENQEALLKVSILRVDQSIMVMRDFGPLTAEFFPARYKISDGPDRRITRNGSLPS